MHRKIRTKDETASGAVYMILFVIIWYSNLLKGVFGGGVQNIRAVLPFLVAGLLPVYTAWRLIHRAAYYRRLHRQYMQTSPRKGRIVNCQKRYFQETAARGRTRTRAEYILIIEVYDSAAFQPVQIQSEAYAWPVYRVLASPEVDVYTDETGWHHVIDGFHYKERKSDPDIFKESPFDAGPGDDYKWERVMWVIVIAVMICMLLSGLVKR